MTHSNEALSRLRGITLEDLTVEQMDSVLGPSSISPNINGQFEQAQLLAGAMAAQRCYAWGLPIPDKSTITSQAVAAGEMVTIRPEGTEIWDIKAIRGFGVGGDATTTMSYADGAIALNLRVDDTVPAAGFLYRIDFQVSSPVRINNALYLTVAETGLSNGLMVLVAYNVVSL